MCDACRSRAYRQRKKEGKTIPKHERQRIALEKQLVHLEWEIRYHRRAAENHQADAQRLEVAAKNVRNAIGQMDLAFPRHEDTSS
jgi:hypothetical protein